MKKIIHKIKNLIYKHESCLLYCKKIYPAQDHGIDKGINISDMKLKTYCEFMEMRKNCQSQIKFSNPLIQRKYKQRFAEGCICFVVTSDKNQIAHYSWVRFANRFIDYVNINLKLSDDEFSIFDSHTFEGCRGLSIYPWTLLQIQKYYNKLNFKRMYIDTKTNNLSSKKGIEKAGFQLLAKYDLLVFGKIVKISQKKEIGDIP